MTLRTEIDASIVELLSLISTYDPIVLLGRVATYVTTGNPENPKDSGGPSKSESNLEYLVSLVAAHAIVEGLPEPSPDAVQRTIDLLTKIQLMAGVCLTKNRDNRSAAEAVIDDLSSGFRMEKLHVRGDGYWPHLRKTILDLLQPHDAVLASALGFTIADYMSFMDRSEAAAQKLLEAELEALEPFLHQIRPWWKKANRSRPEPNDPEGWARFYAENETRLAAGKQRFDRLGDPGMFVLSPQCPAEERILQALSCSCGENLEFRGKKPEHTFFPLTPSLTDRRPILHHRGVYYGFNLLKLQREAYTLIGDALRAKAPEYWRETFLPARDSYLETEAARLFQQVLPSALVLRNVEYPLSTGGNAEADIVVVCDDVLLVVECKAARLDPATKRGAEKKIIADLKETIVGGLTQAERFVRELEAQGTMKVCAGDGATEVVLESGHYRHLFRINITLDLVSVAATQLWKLEKAGLTTGVRHGWSVSLNDLRVIAGVLDQPAVFLHYLLRRLDLDTIRSVHAGDELEYLMRYIRHGLFFRESNAPQANEQVMLTGYTEELDRYYKRLQGLTEAGDKPTISLGVHTQAIVDLLAEQRPTHWLSGSLELLEFDVPVRESLLSKIQADHGPRLSDPRVAYALSVMSNGESRRGVLLASSRAPRSLRHIVVARGIQLCRQRNLQALTVLLGAWPSWAADVLVCHVTGDGEVSSIAAKLIDQLIICTAEHREQQTNP